MAKKERELTKEEQERKEYFEAESRKLTEQGYEKKDLTFGVVAANVWAIVLTVPILIVFWCIYSSNWHMERLSFAEQGLALLAAFVLIVVHELIHGIVFACFVESHWKAVSFGVIWKMLTPYCSCREPLKRIHYLAAILAPTVILGFIPAILSIVYGWMAMFLVALLMIMGGGADMLIAIKLCTYKTKGKECVFFDHPYECGLVVFERPLAK